MPRANNSRTCLDCGQTIHDPTANESRSHRLADEMRDSSVCLVEGQQANYQTALEAMVKMLDAAASPLITGIDALDMSSQIAAWKLADRCRGVIDASVTSQGRQVTQAMQRHGKVASSFGEIRNRSSLVLVWFCDPVDSNPCWWDQLRDRELPGGKRRKVVVVNDRPNRACETADQFIQLDRAQAMHWLNGLRCVSSGFDLEPGALEAAGIELEQVRSLFHQIIAADYGAILHAPADVRFDIDQETESILLLSRELNQHVRFVSFKLTTSFNGVGAEYTLSAMSGFPYAVDFHQGAPQFQPVGNATETLLERQACDALLVADSGSSKVSTALMSATDFLQSIPFIQLLTSSIAQPMPHADVVLSVNPGSDVMRADGVIIAQHQPDTDCPGAKQLFAELADKVIFNRTETGIRIGEF